MEFLLDEVSLGIHAKKLVDLHPGLFKDDRLRVGGSVKAKGHVVKTHGVAVGMPPNISCRIHSFGQICKKIDEKRIRWVTEMGFGGLLHFVFTMQVPRQLAYWVMTRIDPLSRTMVAPDGRVFSFSKNQVRWLLGIPNGSKVVPSANLMSGELRAKVQQLLLKFGSSWKTKSSRGCGSVYISIGIPVTRKMTARLEDEFSDDEEEEFKSIFLIVALHMVLCPTQSPRLGTDLLPALSCVMNCIDYDWRELVLDKLMESVASFARRFYANGYAAGCGGCAMFAVIFYLDRLDRNPVQWDVFPRIKVWSTKQIGFASKDDRSSSGDFGKLGMIDVAYGERHCRTARDTEAPKGNIVVKDVAKLIMASRLRDRNPLDGESRKRRRLDLEH